MRLSFLNAALLFAAAIQPTHAQVPKPAFSVGSVLPANKGRQIPLKPGMLISIYGRNLGPTLSCTAPRHTGRSGVPELCNTRVTVNGIAVGLLYVHTNQINLEIPYRRGIPSEGSAAFVVTHMGASSEAVEIPFAPYVGQIALAGTARTNMPVWVKVHLPERFRESVRYPITVRPHDFGGHAFEVRRNGVPLPPRVELDTLPKMDTGPRAVGMVGGGRTLGVAAKPERAGRLPLHLAFRLDRPGRYTVRYVGYEQSSGSDRRVLVRSPWVEFRMTEFPEAGRARWVDDQRRNAPNNAAELLSDYLPSLLAKPDATVLRIVEKATNHPDTLVRQYARNALSLFDTRSPRLNSASREPCRGACTGRAEHRRP